MNIKLTCLIFSLTFLLSSVATAEAAELCGKLAQGEILVGRAAPGEVIFKQNPIRISEQGDFLIAFGRDDEAAQQITFLNSEGKTQTIDLKIEPTAWDVQNIKGVPPRKVTPSNADLKDIETERKLVIRGQKTDSENPLWKKGFIKPVEGRTSGQFGGQRIMNGVKRNPHAGMDIAAPEGTPVKASSDGIVTLAAPDLFYSGNVVILDHGYGLHTIYAHLKEMHVKDGDAVKQGDIIGLVGKTGRATGPHLHWGASLNGTKFNPPSLLNINKGNDFCFIL